MVIFKCVRLKTTVTRHSELMSLQQSGDNYFNVIQNRQSCKCYKPQMVIFIRLQLIKGSDIY